MSAPEHEVITRSSGRPRGGRKGRGDGGVGERQGRGRGRGGGGRKGVGVETLASYFVSYPVPTRLPAEGEVSLLRKRSTVVTRILIAAADWPRWPSNRTRVVL